LTGDPRWTPTHQAKAARKRGRDPAPHRAGRNLCLQWCGRGPVRPGGKRNLRCASAMVRPYGKGYTERLAPRLWGMTGWIGRRSPIGAAVSPGGPDPNFGSENRSAACSVGSIRCYRVGRGARWKEDAFQIWVRIACRVKETVTSNPQTVWPTSRARRMPPAKGMLARREASKMRNGVVPDACKRAVIGIIGIGRLCGRERVVMSCWLIRMQQRRQLG
jgi:hypothetical protein